MPKRTVALQFHPMQGNLAKLLFLAIALIALPLAALVMTDTTLTLAQLRPARTTKHLMNEVAAARAALSEQNGIESYFNRLKAIDPSRTPRPVQRSFSNYVGSVGKTVEARRKNGNTNAAYAEWLRCEAALDQAASRFSNRQR